jgi:hypothetical protein
VEQTLLKEAPKELFGQSASGDDATAASIG